MPARRFVVPDIHGCARTFSALLEKILNLGPKDVLYLLGDYTDRGPRSKEVIDIIMNLKRQGQAVYTLRGNHDDMLVRACGSLDYLRVWLLNGGRTTLASFGVEDPCEIPSVYRNFLANLPYFFELDKFILVHAGLNFLADDPFKDTEAMLWNRAGAADPRRTKGKTIISGHTPVSRETIRESLATGHILLDNGCVYKDQPGLGTLAALELDTLSLYFMKNIE